ncbi:MAG: DUF465 domain-containing protein [Bryobacteraceae bacterium]
MEKTTEELKAQLLATDEGYRRLAEQHSLYDRQLVELESKPRLTEAEQMEEVRLKKLKLRAKDQMMQMLARFRSGHAG